MKTIIFTFLVFFAINGNSQQIPLNRLTDWNNVGLEAPITSSLTKSIHDFGADSTGATSNNEALKKAINALNGTQGKIVFHAKGTYLFSETIILPDNVILISSPTGSYNRAKLQFNLSQSVAECINISGTIDTNKIIVTSSCFKDAKSISVVSTSGLNIGDYIELRVDGTGFMTSSWAMDDLAQICKITSLSSNTISIDKPLRWDFSLSTNPRIYKVIPRKNVGLECLSISRIDSSPDQSSLIKMKYAVNCYLKGVEGFKPTFAHLDLTKSFRCKISECYFHHAWSYGDGGRGYGVVLQSSTSECLIQNNIFEHLRHSVLFQSGANGNVVGYNYSYDPFWVQSIFPTNSSGEIVMHGNFPFSNLIEGNICDNIVLDNSHGINGPWNTFHRNRASNYGIFMNSGAGDSFNFSSNEILKSTVLFINTYSLTGNGNFQYGNNHAGVEKPTGTKTPEDTFSYYLNSKNPSTIPFLTLPSIGYPNVLNTNVIPAKNRFSTQNKCDCPIIDEEISIFNSENIKYKFHINESILIIENDEEVEEITIYDLNSRKLISESKLKHEKEVMINLSNLQNGIYIIGFKTKKGMIYKKFRY